MAHYRSLSATFIPGSLEDDYYMPQPLPELISPEPQRINPEMSNQIADGIKNMDLESKVPHLSPFPKLVNPPPNVPPSDDELEERLESARQPVLNSNDPEMQLAWAQDALVYVGVCADEAERVAASKPSKARSSTPRIEHQLKIDAMNIVTFLADQHHPKAEFLRGMWLEWGRYGQREDKKEAFRCYSRAVDKGFTRAEYRIGMLYESYNDPIKALRHYNRGVDAGDAASCYRLGMMTLRGQHGQPQDFAKALDLIKKSADAADENAAQGAYVYGMLLARQLPQIDLPDGYLPYDERLARQNIEKAAYMKFAKAQAKMGSCYELGALGCEFSPALSMHYNALASKQGEADADMALSKWFLVGAEGLFPKNEELAYTYAERASQSSLPTAEFALGYFNEIGMYVPVNLDKAMDWYQKAAQHGNEDAKGRIEGLSKKQVLSKKDHENVAISRIKSQHGSMKGSRPERLRQQQPPRLGPVEESASGGTGPTAAFPPRSSSSTPYPADDKMQVAPLNIRPTSRTPYPEDDMQSYSQPQLSPPGPVGGFFRDEPPRPATTINTDPRPNPNFQLSPEIRPNSTLAAAQMPGGGQRPYPPPGPGPAPYGPPAGGYQDGRVPRRPNPGRVVSGPAGLQNFPPQQGGGGPPLPPIPGQIPHQSTAPALPPKKLDIGFSAPVVDQHNRYGPLRPNNSRPPPQPDNSALSPPSVPRPQFDRPGGGAPLAAGGGGGGGGGGGALNGRPPPNAARPAAAGRTNAPMLPPKMPQSATPPAAMSRPPPPPTAVAAAAAAGAGAGGRPSKHDPKGPKTFEEMGVPTHKQDNDCILM